MINQYIVVIDIFDLKLLNKFRDYYLKIFIKILIK